MSTSDALPSVYGTLIKRGLTPGMLRAFMPDILKAVAFVLVLTAIRLQSPIKFGVLLSIVLRRIRVTPTKHHILVSIDGLPTSVWSVRIPRRVPDDTMPKDSRHFDFAEWTNRPFQENDPA